MCYITQNAPYKITVDFMHSCRPVCVKRSCDKSKYTPYISVKDTFMETLFQKSHKAHQILDFINLFH